jgi:integrase
MTAQRRPNGDARPYFDESKGRWCVSIELESGSDGRRRRKKVSGRTKTEARDKARAVRAKLAEGLPVQKERLTTGQYLEWWRTVVLPGTVSDSTRDTYERWLRLYVIPAVGHIPLTKLSPGDVTEMMRAMEVREPPLSAQTRNAARKVLGRALRRAMQEELVYRNVASIVDGPQMRRSERRSLTPDQAKVLVTAFSSERLGVAYLLALALGLRRGEVLGLRWIDILETDPAWVHVHSQLQRRPRQGLVLLDHLKGAKRGRKLVLVEPVLAALRTRRAQQAAERLACGALWQDQLGLVFTTAGGAPVDPDNFGHDLAKITERAGLGAWTTHELRHSAGSLLYAMGVPMKVISELLGHSSERVTSDVYVHIQQPQQVEAAEAIKRALWG